MRIISGSARGKKLAIFSGTEVRPTPDRVREAVFSMLLSRLGSFAGLEVLDLFAGTGAMGLEALSRGAKGALLVDKGTQSARIIPTNIEHCGLADQARFLKADVLKALVQLKAQKPFNLIFLDPPYGMGLVPEVIALISRNGLLAEDGLVCAEEARSAEVPDQIDNLVCVDRRVYGQSAVHFFSFAEM